jgi:hypothetical protein
MMPANCEPEPLPTFFADVTHSSRAWLPSLVSFAACTWWLCDVWDAQLLVHWLSWLPIGFVLIPVSFALATMCCAAILTVMLSLMATPAWLLGRATGLASLLTDLWRLPAHILPGFWGAIRRIRNPHLWGAIIGGLVGLSLFGAIRGYSG